MQLAEVHGAASSQLPRPADVVSPDAIPSAALVEMLLPLAAEVTPELAAVEASHVRAVVVLHAGDAAGRTRDVQPQVQGSLDLLLLRTQLGTDIMFLDVSQHSGRLPTMLVVGLELRTFQTASRTGHLHAVDRLTPHEHGSVRHGADLKVRAERAAEQLLVLSREARSKHVDEHQVLESLQLRIVQAPFYHLQVREIRAIIGNHN
eukprot:749446-Hanusia_phi.AAC.7